MSKSRAPIPAALSRIKSLPSLPEEALLGLWRSTVDGDSQAAQKLAQGLARAVLGVAQRYAKTGNELEEFYANAMAAAHESVLRFKPELGGTITGGALVAARGAIVGAIRNSIHQRKREVMSVDTNTDDGQTELMQEVLVDLNAIPQDVRYEIASEHAHFQAEIKKALRQCPQPVRTAMQLLYLNGEHCLSLTECAQRMKITKRTVLKYKLIALTAIKLSLGLPP